MADPTTRAGTVPHEPKHLVVPESRVIRSLLGHDKGMGEEWGVYVEEAVQKDDV